MHLLFLAAVLSVKLVVQRPSLDLLDSLPISVVVENGAAAAQTVSFAQPAEYAIELRTKTGAVLWSTQAAAQQTPANFPPHARTFAPGATTLAIYDWNELLADGTSIAPGRYVLRARLLSGASPPESSIGVTFAAPLSPSSVPALKAGEAFTLAGKLDAARALLSDERAGVALSRRILAAPAGTPVVVRGIVVVRPDGARVFSVERWAPLGGQPASVR